MSNSYFSFKQFTVHQDSCAMKVSTDACIQGAWTRIPVAAKNILDIGTGTGLLSLMLAQRYDQVKIEGIELDEPAAKQAAENVAQSPWADRINIINDDAASYQYSTGYDVIISNPPFFNDSLLGKQLERNQARHTITLTYNRLFEIISSTLEDSGIACVLLPSGGMVSWQNILKQNGWHITGILHIHPRIGKEANRVVVICSRIPATSEIVEHLYIRNMDDVYTPEFVSLMSGFYLNL